ncbi:MAG: ArsR family transcriptional regulator [Thermoprotei archaeon]|nr:MAG: ArsR family transcriptional regulator [Thermoprotei archaeon]
MEREELGETTVRVYTYMVERGVPLGPRELARALGLSPSVVYYHLKKLEELGVVKRTSNGYVVVRRLRISGFLYLGRWLVPRLLLYSLFFLGLLVSEVISLIIRLLHGLPISVEFVLLLVTTSVAFIITFVEGFIVRRKLFT